LFVALGLAFVFSQLGGCYNPTIADGKLQCSPKTPSCPDGFHCVQDRCFKDGGTGGAPSGGSGGTGTGGTAGTGGAGGTGGTGTGGMCLKPAPLPGCSAQGGASGGTCDIACQTGCGCNEKCSALDDNTHVCQPIRGNVQEQENCVISTDPGSQQKSDNCAPGLVCLTDGGITARCFALCSDTSPCTSSVCSQRFLLGTHSSNGTTPTITVCGGPLSDCDPLGPKNPVVCGNCVLQEPVSGISRTACEPWIGEVRGGQPCFTSADCLDGSFYCPQNKAGKNFHLCSPICKLQSPVCPAGNSCFSIDGGGAYGFCAI
jgi:hypothetical protein